MKIEASGGGPQLKSIVTGNTIQLVDTSLYDAFVPEAASARWALVIQAIGFYPTNITISDNIIDGWSGYHHGVYTQGVGASITGNTINNIAPGGWGIYNYGTPLTVHSTITGNTISKEDGVIIAGYIATSATAAIYGNTLSHANLAAWSGSVDGYGDLSDSNFNGIVGPGATFAAWNVNQVVRTVPNLASAIPLFNITPVGNSRPNSIVNEERLLYGAPGTNQFLNKGLQKVTFNESQGWVWTWNGGNLDSNDGTVGLIIPLSSILPDRAYLLSVSVTLYFSCNWDVYANGLSINTWPEIYMELNGNMVASSNPFTDPAGPHFTSVTLTYQSDALVSGNRPEAPLIKELVIKMRQTAVNVPSFGGWVGPTGAGIQTMRIGQPWITYMY